MNGRIKSRIVTFGAILLLLAGLPAILQSEVLILKDGSEVKGKIVTFEGDTLVFAPSFGGKIYVHRDNIVKIIYDESVRETSSGVQPDPVGDGVLRVVFKNNKLSSKIALTSKYKAYADEIIRANWIDLYLIVGIDTVYTRVDTTMDKTVYKGHERLYKNTVRLEDMQVTLPAGSHRCEIVIRNRGAQSHENLFDEGPLDLHLVIDMISVTKGLSTTVNTAIKKGFLRSGSPRLVAAD
jgi:hypothetical protein